MTNSYKYNFLLMIKRMKDFMYVVRTIKNINHKYNTSIILSHINRYGWNAFNLKMKRKIQKHSFNLKKKKQKSEKSSTKFAL